ncbi:hypothetical protein GGQ99_001310 [Aminobacter niigataensis]|uniref:Uncharacterized protein n=1 Tax=Aminobacter niigataensis TaxID=83265 RepID=A0ABR6KYU8_9HYPH|nr:hypothetical protein [Aminobacter niigataensis]MBB4649588.1 hypothetical protein [Aminobacter niigataensis]
MSQSSALQFDYSEKAAIADLITIVRARFIEAADTMAHMDVRNLRPAAVRSLWPAVQVEAIGGHHPGYSINGNHVPYRPSSKAISRAEEVMYGWLLDYVDGDENRILVGKWSMCLAAPRVAGSFRHFCKKSGRSRSTAERRLNDAFEHVARLILKNAQSLQAPNWSRVVPMMPNQGSDLHIVATGTHWMADGAKPTIRPDLLEPVEGDAQRQKAA